MGTAIHFIARRTRLTISATLALAAIAACQPCLPTTAPSPSPSAGGSAAPPTAAAASATPGPTASEFATASPLPAATVDSDMDPAAQTAIENLLAAPEVEVQHAIEIRCLGELQVQVGDRLVVNKDWRGFKTKLILAYLLAHPAGVTKEQLTDMLYGEMDTTRTATLVLISRLRHALEPDLAKQTPSRFIHFLDGRYTFNFAIPYKLDTAELAYHCQRGADAGLSLADRRRHLELALASYEGPYLAELVAESPWLEIERERYHRMAQEAHTALIRSYMEEGDDAKALHWAEANLAFDACCEFAHQVKMHCLARLGQREVAIRHYSLMRQVFERELGGPPSPESERLFQAISDGREASLPLR